MLMLASLCLLLAALALSAAKPASPDSIRHVRVVYMNHLDVGFDGIDPVLGFAKNVVNRYFDVYFPRALATAQKLRADGGALDYVYTTHAYLVSLFLECPPGLGLHCPTPDARAAFVEGVARGDIVWHAFPFNAQCEWAEPSLLAFGVELAQTLAARHNISVAAGDSDSHSDIESRSDSDSGGRSGSGSIGIGNGDSGSSLRSSRAGSGRNGGNGGRPTTMSQRDVPGTTRAMLPLLAAAGVRALSFGANEASAPLIVPQIFRWRDEASGVELLTMYHPSGYGNISTAECVTIDGMDTALAMAFRGDNAGPHAPDEVEAIVAQLIAQFPNANASVRASTFDAFVDRALPFADRVPLVTGEMGDTWIYGVPADPYKTAALREAMSARRACFDAGACSPIDERVYNFSRLLIKGVEHTWGGDTKKFLNDTEYAQWSNAAFDAMRATSANVAQFERSWREQRVWALDAPLAALQDHPLAAEISKRWAALRRSVPRDPALLGFMQLTDPAQWSQTWTAGELAFAFDATTGVIASLVDQRTGAVWADADHPLAQMLYQTYDEKDVDHFLAQYSNCDPFTDCTWALKDFGKFNISSAQPVSATVGTRLEQFWYRSPGDEIDERSNSAHRGSSSYGGGTGLSFLLQLSLPSDAHTLAGAPATIWLQVTVSNQSALRVTLLWADKTPTRLPESVWLRFGAAADAIAARKAGAWIDTSDVLGNGSTHLHGLWADVRLQRGPAAVAPAEAPGIASLRPSSADPLPSSSSSSSAAAVSASASAPAPASAPASPRLEISSPHAAVVSVGRALDKLGAYPTPFAAADPRAGVAFSLVNNLWGTNYIMWYPFAAEDAVTAFDFDVRFY